MKCIRCNGTGKDPRSEIWDDTYFSNCPECYCGYLNLLDWIKQAVKYIRYILRNGVPK